MSIWSRLKKLEEYVGDDKKFDNTLLYIFNFGQKELPLMERSEQNRKNIENLEKSIEELTRKLNRLMDHLDVGYQSHKHEGEVVEKEELRETFDIDKF